MMAFMMMSSKGQHVMTMIMFVMKNDHDRVRDNNARDEPKG